MQYKELNFCKKNRTSVAKCRFEEGALSPKVGCCIGGFVQMVARCARSARERG